MQPNLSEQHALEITYGLSAFELLDAIRRRFRLKTALEGAVAEVHFGKKLAMATKEGWLPAFREHDSDGMHDFSIEMADSSTVRIEVKTIRSSNGRPMLPIAVELQKTRASTVDASSRFYGRDAFDLVAVNIGRASGDWTDFRYCWVRDLPPHGKHPNKIQVMNRLERDGIWYSALAEALANR